MTEYFNHTLTVARDHFESIKRIQDYLEASLLHYCVEDLPLEFSHLARPIDLYANYVEWCESMVHPVAEKMHFFEAFESKGFKKITHKRIRYYQLDTELTEWK